MSIEWKAFDFLRAAHELVQLPNDEGYEVVFAGRSNAGKSSALNAITGNPKLARISKTPGRTQQFVIFQYEEGRRLIDLPGYGYAKVSHVLKEHWQSTLTTYFHTRQTLQGLMIAMDIRHPMREFDCMMLQLAASRNIPCHVLLTKADKIGHGQRMNCLHKVQTELKAMSGSFSVQTFSVPAKIGVPQAREVITTWLKKL